MCGGGCTRGEQDVNVLRDTVIPRIGLSPLPPFRAVPTPADHPGRITKVPARFYVATTNDEIPLRLSTGVYVAAAGRMCRCRASISGSSAELSRSCPYFYFLFLSHLEYESDPKRRMCFSLIRLISFAFFPREEVTRYPSSREARKKKEEGENTNRSNREIKINATLDPPIKLPPPLPSLD